MVKKKIYAFFIGKYGKRAVLIYVAWCVIKGLALLWIAWFF